MRGVERRRGARARARRSAAVQIADPDSVLERYPHQLSGGMQQRVVIAMALAKDPALLILDEPTTGLDATVEAEVLDLIAQLQADFNTAVLFISHNLGVIRKMCERVGVLYAGSWSRRAASRAILHDPRHPYTVGLIRCIPRGGVRKDRGRLDTIPGFLPTIGEQLAGLRLRRSLRARAGDLLDRGAAAVQLGGLHVEPLPLPRAGAASCRARAAAERRARSRSTAPASRSCGSTTSAKVFRQHGTQIHALDRRVGRDLARRDARTRRRVRQRQDDARAHAARDRRADARRGRARGARARAAARQAQPQRTSARSRSSSRTPTRRSTAGTAIRRILLRSLKKLGDLTGEARRARLIELMASGAARRALPDVPARLALRRAQAARRDRARVRRQPELVVCDEPTSALDVSVQAAILNLLVELQAQRAVAYLFISHDLGVVRYISDRIAVLYLGRLMELGPAAGRLRRSASSVHRGAALGGADDRRRRPRADQARGRDPERGRAAHRLRLPHALPSQGRARSASSRSRRSSRSTAAI